jgi:cytochrome b561
MPRFIKSTEPIEDIMAAKSTSHSYGSVAIAIHWLSAILIIILLASGFRAANVVDVTAKADALMVHAPAGITALILTLARIAWWVFADRKPDPAGGVPDWQEKAAKAVHILFYVIILGMAASGIGMFVLSGAGPIVFGGADAVLPDFWNYPPRIPHAIGARVLVALLVLHIGAAFYHHFALKDGLLRRIWFPR